MEGRLNDECDFGVLSVTIQSVTDKTVTFQTRSASKSGSCNECLLRSYTVPLTEVYTKAIAGAPAPVAMMPGASGNLFLSSAGWQAKSADGFAIYGIEHAVFKWPLCAAAPSRVLSSLDVVPSSVVLHGHLEGDSEFFELELLGEDAADAQDIHWNGAGFVELRLSQLGAARLRVKSRSTVVRAWPTRIVVHGSPSFDRTVSGAVDLLNREAAGEVQHLAISKHRPPIALSLTQDGVNEFHVTPQALAELAPPASNPALRIPHAAAEYKRAD